ncbi:hypothetical protein [Chitinolyticbacter meiyuanensis]|uniref:Nmad2 family putative nucleotide modification protein n=1 Tax=Chitinolyticbacter meiyuanensis TaxID=682798 RepID=UPI0011E5D267|nr:hypothetical protein [Chitinolyticbacter meiyuanensis]
MTKLFSYVVDHDNGFAPNPSNGVCTLVHCKFGGEKGRRNIVEFAQVGDWILGSGGGSAQSAGNRKIIYLMRVDEKLHFHEFLEDSRFSGRIDHIDLCSGNLFALVSHHFFYFGRSAIEGATLPATFSPNRLFKRYSGFRSDLPPILVESLTNWFEENFKLGKHGEPCSPLHSTQSKFDAPNCSSICNEICEGVICEK